MATLLAVLLELPGSQQKLRAHLNGIIKETAKETAVPRSGHSEGAGSTWRCQGKEAFAIYPWAQGRTSGSSYWGLGGLELRQQEGPGQWYWAFATGMRYCQPMVQPPGDSILLLA